MLFVLNKLQIPDYNQSMNSPEACRRRLMKYLFPVIVFSLIFNIPKFLEAKIVWSPSSTNVSETVLTTTIASVVSSLNQTDANSIDEQLQPNHYEPSVSFICYSYRLNSLALKNNLCLKTKNFYSILMVQYWWKNGI